MALAAERGSASAPAPSGSGAGWSALWGIGMTLVFVGERVIAVGKGRAVASGLGVALLLLAFVARSVRATRLAPDRRSVERRFLTMYALGMLAIALYFLQSDVPTLRGGKALETTSPKLATALAALWPVLWCLATFAIVAMELAYGPLRRAPRIEVRRLVDAQFSGLGFAFVLTFAFAAVYVASERDQKVDLAYFRTTRPGESTRKVVRALDQKLTVAIFFPNGNEVREEVDNYFSDLARESGQLKIEHYDFDVDPAKARELGVSANGIVVFVRGTRREQLGLQLTMEAARGSLKTLDREVQQRLLSVTKPGRVTMLTYGHGERSANPVGGDTDRRPGIKQLRDALLDQGQDVRDLGPGEGLATDVPKDATVVMVVGPTKPFAPEEIASLQRFLDRGGRIFLALDPDGGVDMHELLDPFGVKLTMKTLANDQVFARRSHQDAERVNLVTGAFSSHPSVSTLSRYGMRAAVLLPGATAIEGPRERPGSPKKDFTVDYPVHAHFATFSDDDGDFMPGAKEQRRAFELAAAISKKIGKEEERLFVVGDSDFLTDAVLGFGGNSLLALDSIRWLLGEESFAGKTSSEADVPITHTRKQDVAWFYSTVIAAPVLVLALGFVVTRQRRRVRGGARKTPPPGPNSGSGDDAAAGGQS